MKAVKIIILSCLMTGIFQTAIPQQIKSYNGPFKEGTATYQYYDDNYERVYQGSFTYTSEYLNITGQYNKNVKVGKWSFTKRTNPLYENLKETLVGEYNNGKMNGLWTLKRTDLKTNKILINSSAFFKEGYLTSEFKYYNSRITLNPYGQNSDISLTGKFNNNGNFDSIWVTNYKINEIPFENIKKLKDGILYFNLTRNLSTGEIIEKYDDPIGEDILDNTFDYSLTHNPDNLYSRVFEVWVKIKKIETYESEDLNIYHSFSTNYNLTDIVLDNFQNKKISEFNSIISKADSAYNDKKYDDAIILYRKALTIYGSDYANSQLEKLNHYIQTKAAKEDREKSMKTKEHNDSVYRESAVYKDQLKMQKEAEENRGPKYKRIINVLKK